MKQGTFFTIGAVSGIVLTLIVTLNINKVEYQSMQDVPVGAASIETSINRTTQRTIATTTEQKPTTQVTTFSADGCALTVWEY